MTILQFDLAVAMLLAVSLLVTVSLLMVARKT